MVVPHHLKSAFVLGLFRSNNYKMFNIDIYLNHTIVHLTTVKVNDVNV